MTPLQAHQIQSIVNNQNILNLMYNLYERWQDEYRYEDPKEYQEAIFKAITKEHPNIPLTNPTFTKRPFGIKVYLNDLLLHIWLSIGKGPCWLKASAAVIQRVKANA